MIVQKLSIFATLIRIDIESLHVQIITSDIDDICPANHIVLNARLSFYSAVNSIFMFSSYEAQVPFYQRWLLHGLSNHPKWTVTLNSFVFKF